MSFIYSTIEEKTIKDINNEIKLMNKDGYDFTDGEIRGLILSQKSKREHIYTFLNNVYDGMPLDKFKELENKFFVNYESDVMVDLDKKVTLKYRKYYLDKYEKEIFYLENLYTIFTN